MSSVYWVSWLTGILSPQAMVPPEAILPVASQALDGVRETEVMAGWTPMVKLTLALLLVRSPAANVSLPLAAVRLRPLVLAAPLAPSAAGPWSSVQVAVTSSAVPSASASWTLPEMV